MAGRPPKATNLLLLEGGWRKDRHAKRKNEPQPEGRLGGPPAWLSAEEREVWTTGLKQAPGGLLTPLDASVYTVWCVARTHHRRVAEQLGKMNVGGLLARTPARVGARDKDGKPTTIEGTLQASPFVNILNKQAMIMMKAAEQLGFSPVARARISTGEPAPKDDDAEFFNDD